MGFFFWVAQDDMKSLSTESWRPFFTKQWVWEQMLEGHRRSLWLSTQYFSSGWSQAHWKLDNFLALFEFNTFHLWSCSALVFKRVDHRGWVEIEYTWSPVYTARAPRSSSSGIAFHLKWLKCFTRKVTGFTGLLFKSWGAPMSRDQWPEGASWMTGGEQESTPNWGTA